MFVWNALGLGEPLNGPRLGIECETEGRLPGDGPAGWRAERDGSLRDGMEYVTDGSIEPMGVKKAITQLHKHIKDAGGKVNYSFRCSTHVHCNVQDLTDWQVVNCIFSYMLFENVFMNYVAPGRVGNRFCLRFQDAQHLTMQVCRFIQNLNEYGDHGLQHAIVGLRQENLKYAALNLYTLRKYGTLEFRALEGTDSPEKIDIWCQAIVRWRHNATRYGSPKELYESFIENPTAMAMEIFGHAPEAFLKPGWQNQVEEGYSQNLAVLMYL